MTSAKTRDFRRAVRRSLFSHLPLSSRKQKPTRFSQSLHCCLPFLLFSIPPHSRPLFPVNLLGFSACSLMARIYHSGAGCTPLQTCRSVLPRDAKHVSRTPPGVGITAFGYPVSAEASRLNQAGAVAGKEFIPSPETSSASADWPFNDNSDCSWHGDGIRGRNHDWGF